MLPAANRLRNGKDFARTTKTGARATSLSLVLYAITHAEFSQEPKVGLIVNKSIGGSVVRHRVSRQLRHLIKDHLAGFPQHSQIVIRVLRNSEDFKSQLEGLVIQVQKKLLVKS